MILRFGNVTLLSMEELSGKLFTGNGTKMSIMKDGGRWEDHPLDTTVYGVNVEVKRGREGGEGGEGGREKGRERRKGGGGGEGEGGTRALDALTYMFMYL